MDFPDPGLNEQEEIEQLLKDIRTGFCVGEYSETGEIKRPYVSISLRSEPTNIDVSKQLLDRLIEEGRIEFENETHPLRPGECRRIYRVANLIA